MIDQALCQEFDRVWRSSLVVHGEHGVTELRQIRYTEASTNLLHQVTSTLTITPSLFVSTSTYMSWS